MTKNIEAPQMAQNSAPIVFVVTRYGNIYGIYDTIENAQQVQRTFIAKGNICDLQVHSVKSNIL